MKAEAFKYMENLLPSYKKKNDKVNISGMVGSILVGKEWSGKSSGLKPDIIYQKTYLRYIQW